MSTVHVLPLGDTVDHTIPGGWDGHGDGCPDCADRGWLGLEAGTDEDTDCACLPTAELVPNAHGADGWMFTHHSLDGREQRET